MKLLLIVIVLSFSLAGHAQSSINDSADFEFLKGKLSFPVDRFTSLETSGQRRKPMEEKQPIGHYADCSPTETLTIRSDSSMLVKNPAQGKVLSVFEIDNIYALIIRHGRYFLCYYNLDTVLVKKGDTVTNNQPLGKILSLSNEGAYELELMIMTEGNTKSIDPFP